MTSTTEEQGLEVVQALAQFGVASSYEARKGVPVVELGLEQAKLLVRVLAALADTGQVLAEYAAYLDSEGDAQVRDVCVP